MKNEAGIFLQINSISCHGMKKLDKNCPPKSTIRLKEREAHGPLCSPEKQFQSI